MRIHYYTAVRNKIEYRHLRGGSLLEHWLASVATFTALVAVAGAAFNYCFPSAHSLVIHIPVVAFLALFQYYTLIFCNGWMLALFCLDDRRWKLVFTICFVYTFGSTVYVLLQPWFFTCWWLCGSSALWAAYFVYSRFHFLRDESPVGGIGFYRAGLRFGGLSHL